MRLPKSFLAALCAATFVGSFAPTAQAQIAPTAAPAPAFSWQGFYIGGYAGVIPGIPNGLIGTRAGYNFSFGRVVAGVEGEVGLFLAGAALANVAVRARLGAIIRPRAIAYYSATLGLVPFVPGVYFGFGGGVEYAVAPDISVFGEVGIIRSFGAPGFLALQTGVHWHP